MTEPIEYQPRGSTVFYRLGDNTYNNALYKSRLRGYQLHKLQTRGHAIDRFNAYKAMQEKYSRYQNLVGICQKLEVDIEKLDNEIKQKEKLGSIAYEGNPVEQAEILAIKKRTLEALRNAYNTPLAERILVVAQIEDLKKIVYDAEYQELVAIIEQCNHMVEFYSTYKKIVSERFQEKDKELKGKFPEDTPLSQEDKLAQLEEGYLPTDGDALEGIE